MHLVNRLFNLRPGDFARGLPLFLYYLLIVMFYMLGRNSRDSIFLDVFDRTKLPYADIAVAALSGVLVAIYLRASRGANLRNLQVGTLAAFAAMLPMLWFGVHVEQSKAVSVIYYVWVGVCGMLCISQVWMLANAVWTTREAKRRFGMLGSGGIVRWHRRRVRDAGHRQELRHRCDPALHGRAGRRLRAAGHADLAPAGPRRRRA
jgi:AAA family ATP:ADP antiporter